MRFDLLNRNVGGILRVVVESVLQRKVALTIIGDTVGIGGANAWLLGLGQRSDGNWGL